MGPVGGEVRQDVPHQPPLVPVQPQARQVGCKGPAPFHRLIQAHAATHTELGVGGAGVVGVGEARLPPSWTIIADARTPM